MVEFEIYFHDLTIESQARLMGEFNTNPDDENWDIVPLAILNRDDVRFE